MILRAIRVQSFGVLNPGFEVGELSDGITVIHGLNEAGKSTLLRALTYGLYQRHKLGGDEVEREIVPVGTSLAPHVEVEFEAAGQRWMIEKTFIKRRSARLSRFEHAKYVPVADGDEADEELKRLLESDYAGKGKAKSEHRGIGQVLICDQDELRSVHALGERARSTLRAVLGTVTATREGRGLSAAVSKRHDELFTDKEELRSTSECSRIAASLEELERDLGEVAVQETEVRALEGDLEQAMAAEAASTQRHEQLVDALREAETDDRRRLELEALVSGKRTECASTQERLRASEALERKIHDASLALEELTPGLERARKGVERANEALSAERTRLEVLQGEQRTLEEGRVEIDESVRRGEDSLKAAQARARLDELEPRLANYSEALSAEAAVEGELGATARPSRPELEAISKLRVDLDRQRTGLESLALRLRIQAHIPLRLRGPTDTRELAVGESAELTGLSPLSVEIENVAGIEVLGPQSQSAPELKSKIASLERQLRERTDPFGTLDPTALEQSFAKRVELEKRKGEHVSRRQGLFATQQTYESATKEASAKRTELASVLERRPEWHDAIPSLAQATDLVASSKLLSAEREGRIRSTQGAITEALRRSEQAEADRRQRNEELEGIRLRSAELGATLSALGGATDPAVRASEFETLRVQNDRLADELAAIEKELTPLGEAGQSLKRARRELSEFERLQETRERTRNENRGKLDLLRNRGLYAEKSDLEEKSTEFADRLARARLEAEAVRLLSQAFEEEERRSVDTILAPVADKVHRMATAVLRRDAGIAFAEDLSTTGVRLEGQDFTVTQLSGGTQDQFALFVRIAFAELYAEKHSRHALILDDPLANSDGPRRRRALDVIARAANKLQILIFTCREEDYLGLDAAQVAMPVTA